MTIPAESRDRSGSGAGHAGEGVGQRQRRGAAVGAAERITQGAVRFDCCSGADGLGRDEAVAKMTAAMRADGQWGEERDDKWCRATVTTLLGRKDENIPWEETEEKGVYTLKAGAADGAGAPPSALLRLVRR